LFSDKLVATIFCLFYIPPLKWENNGGPLLSLFVPQQTGTYNASFGSNFNSPIWEMRFQ